jgi:sirohydrochlorin ferrochelatase
MKALLLVAHGSRRAVSNDEVRALAQRMARQAEGFDLVDCAFLELAEPLIPEGIARCVARGAAQIQVLPYFLAEGRHVAEDIPREVAAGRLAHPGVVIHLLPHLGLAEGLAGLLIAHAR